MKLRKSTLRRAGIAALVAAVVAAVMVGITLASGGVSILTPPIHQNAAVYRDLDADGINNPEELVGNFDVYDGMQPVTIRWPATAFPAGANGSYRVSLWQNTTPFGAPTWKEVTFGHHWASNPNGTQFTFGPFGPGQLCVTCPSLFQVQPETYTVAYNAATDSYEYTYTPLSSDLSQPAALEESEEVILNVTDYSAPPEEDDSPGGSDCTCDLGTYYYEICGGFYTGNTCFPPG